MLNARAWCGEERVKPAPFAYERARSLDHAIELLRKEPEARVLAGGQSLIATLNMRLSQPRLLVDINHVNALKGIEKYDGGLQIGALTRYAEAERSAEIARHVPLIAKALPFIGHPSIRNRGTIGGSIAFGDPAAELPACLLALGGGVVTSGPSGLGTVAADAFYKGLYETALAPGEIVFAIRVPVATAETRAGFAEFARRHGDYAIAGLAATARTDGKKLSNVRLAFFGVGATPVRARGAEMALAGGDLEGAVAALANDLDPPDDVQASSAVKRHLAGVLLRRVARELMEPRP
jgi:carbon-monoxide dehydrogenase medium subunit